MDHSYPSDASLAKATPIGYKDPSETPQNSNGDISPGMELESTEPGLSRRTRRQVKAKPRGRGYLQIVVKQDETPSRRLVLKMIDLEKNLARVNRRIMSGTAVSEGEWETLRLMSTKLGSTFKNEVEFSWQRGTEQARTWDHRAGDLSEPFSEHGNHLSDVNETNEEKPYNTVHLEESDDEDFESAADVEEANWGDRLLL